VMRPRRSCRATRAHHRECDRNSFKSKLRKRHKKVVGTINGSVPTINFLARIINPNRSAASDLMAIRKSRAHGHSTVLGPAGPVYRCDHLLGFSESFEAQAKSSGTSGTTSGLEREPVAVIE